MLSTALNAIVVRLYSVNPNPESQWAVEYIHFSGGPLEDKKSLELEDILKAANNLRPQIKPNSGDRVAMQAMVQYYNSTVPAKPNAIEGKVELYNTFFKSVHHMVFMSQDQDITSWAEGVLTKFTQQCGDYKADINPDFMIHKFLIKYYIAPNRASRKTLVPDVFTNPNKFVEGQGYNLDDGEDGEDK